MNKLPLELLELIVDGLPFNDYISLTMVNKAYYNCLSNNLNQYLRYCYKPELAIDRTDKDENNYIALINACYIGGLKVVIWLHQNNKINMMYKKKSLLKQYNKSYSVEESNKIQSYNDKYGYSNDNSAIIVACYKGNYDIFKYLFDNNLYNKSYKKYMANKACHGGNLDIVMFLHNNKIGGFDKKSINIACVNGHNKIALFLIENRMDGYSSGLLLSAINNNLFEVVKILYEKNCNGTSKSNMRKAMIEAHNNGNLEFVEWSIKEFNFRRYKKK